MEELSIKLLCMKAQLNVISLDGKDEEVKKVAKNMVMMEKEPEGGEIVAIQEQMISPSSLEVV